jgi:hypothetical protein
VLNWLAWRTRSDVAKDVEIDAVFIAIDVWIINTPVRAPRANLIAEPFVGDIRREVLDRIRIFNQQHAAAVRQQYERHYHDHRPHCALGKAASLRPAPRTTTEIHNVRRCGRLGRLMHEYQQVASGAQSSRTHSRLLSAPDLLHT